MANFLKSRVNPGRISIALVLSYIIDWLVIIAAVGLGAGLAVISPNKRPFSLVNPEISYPFVNKEKVPTLYLGLYALIIPAAIIFFVAIVLVPGPTVPRSAPKSLIWQRKLWEWHTGWLGLALSLGSAFLITQGMKNLFGKPRPDLLSRCQPDLANINDYIIGGFPGIQSQPGVNGLYLVSAAICKNTDKDILDDGFRSYPSGHASFAAGGLIYLSLFLASKLATTIPYLAPTSYSPENQHLSAFPSRLQTRQNTSRSDKSETSNIDHELARSGHDDKIIGARNQAAAPPIYLLVLTIVPWFASIYIASTRYSDFRHHGFDILFGYLIGTITSIFAFRFYHLPIRQGAGWSWGPRSRHRSFWAGVGVGSYVGPKEGENRQTIPTNRNDLESGNDGVQRHVSNEVGVHNGTGRAF
ncbi:PAP2 superfamily-domain-containing protein [Bisporella sp. PMI_857]|nr:PAP2 superfamily-domain-containing protein [Bisporella sp. PMI_857]